MADVLIPKLSIGNWKETICVRVSRFWDFCDPQDEAKLLHSDLVLLDEEGNGIHAQMYPPLPDKFRPLIKEGGVYNLAYFRVKKSNRLYKPVTNENMINFTNWTTLEEVVEIPPAFPILTYSPTPIEQIPTRIDYKEYYIDVIGVITSISSVSSQRSKGQQTASLKRTISIRDASNASVNVVLWGGQATAFPGEQICKDGHASPQIIVFVGTLIKKYSDGVCLSGSSPCRWYINPDVPETSLLMARIVHKPIKWNEMLTSSQPVAPVAEEQKVSYIKYLHPFENKRKEFLVTVTIKKIDNKWSYTSCRKCTHSATVHGDSYKCSDSDCNTIGMPAQRYRLSVIAGDETGDTSFVLFGRIAQRLIKRPADTLIANTPTGFIPDAITKLLEKTFVWNVSFSENTISSGNVCFQVNAVIGEIDTGNTLLPMSPGGSQQSSLMLSQGANSSMHNTPDKGSTSVVPTTPLTPQGGRSNNEDKITLQPRTDTTLLIPGTAPGPLKASGGLTSSPSAPQCIDVADVEEVGIEAAGDAGIVVASSTTKTQKNTAGKRTRSSPNKAVAKKLFMTTDGGRTIGEGCADEPAEPGASKDA